MALRIEDYGLIGDMHTAALVGIDGSIDWLCLPRFDSSACFANLLGTEENGRWRIAPAGDVVTTTRRYRPSTLVLETEFQTAEGVVRLIDCMTLRESNPRIVRIVEGVRGTVSMSARLNPRFDYGKTAPWILAKDQAVSAGAGPEAVELRTNVPITSRERCLEAEFSVRAGAHRLILGEDPW
ncbi:MAG: glycoside hydrolase family 15 protein, partial [Variovorax sp.]